MKRILIMAGGTGGHIFPGLAVAKKLQTKGIKVHWLGTSGKLESKLVPQAGIPIHYIKMQGVRGKGWVGWMLAPFRLFFAIGQAIQIIRRIKPDLVLGFGGFVSAPGGLAAWMLRKPLVIHEQNAVSGAANRCLSFLADQVFQAFPDTFASKKAITCGNPVRAEILALAPPEQRFHKKLKTLNAPLQLLVIGGSQGALLFNEIIPKTIQGLAPLGRPEIWHAAGKNHEDKTKVLYDELGVSAKVAAFIDDMAEAYAWADLVICRSGALTVAEIAAVGLASILVPYPHAIDNHQAKNAAWLADHHAAIAIPQHEFKPARLILLLSELSINKSKLFNMAIMARNLANTDAAEQIADYMIPTLYGSGKVQSQTRR